MKVKVRTVNHNDKVAAKPIQAQAPQFRKFRCTKCGLEFMNDTSDNVRFCPVCCASLVEIKSAWGGNDHV